MDASGNETDTLIGYQAGDQISLDTFLYSVAAVHQNGPDEVQVFLRDAPPGDESHPLTGEIVLENLKGVSASQVATMLNAPLAEGPVANNGVDFAGPSESLDLTSFVAGLYGPGSGAADDRNPKLISVGPVNPYTGGTVIYNNGSISFLTPPNGAAGAFTYSLEDEYGDIAQGTITVETESWPDGKLCSRRRRT